MYVPEGSTVKRSNIYAIMDRIEWEKRQNGKVEDRSWKGREKQKNTRDLEPACVPGRPLQARGEEREVSFQFFRNFEPEEKLNLNRKQGEKRRVSATRRARRGS